MGVIKELTDNCSIFRGDKTGSGVILLGHDNGVMVIESANNALSELTMGLRDKQLIARCKEDLEPLVKAAFICHLKDTGKLCQDSDEIRKLNDYVIETTCLTFGYDVEDVKTNLFENLVGDFLAKAFSEGGVSEVETITKVIKIAQRKNKPLPSEREIHFVESVRAATSAAGKAPTQKDVFDIWEDGGDYNDYDVFRVVRDRLGFDWLPEAKRGRRVHD